VDGAVAQQEATYDDSGNTGDGKRDHRGSEDSEVVRKGTGVVDNGSHTGDLVREQGLLRESATTGRTPGGLGLQYQGHHGRDGPVHVGRTFLKVREMGRLEGLEETEKVVRRHR